MMRKANVAEPKPLKWVTRHRSMGGVCVALNKRPNVALAEMLDGQVNTRLKFEVVL